jgi:hypothetical protein
MLDEEFAMPPRLGDALDDGSATQARAVDEVSQARPRAALRVRSVGDGEEHVPDETGDLRVFPDVPRDAPAHVRPRS